MSFEVPSRTHIVPMGYERKRVYEPAIRLNADEVVIISHQNNQGEFVEYYEDVKKHLVDNSISVKRETCDIFNVYDSLEVIGREISKCSRNEVFVNVSSGSKITAIAGMIASMTSRATPYYARARDYSGDAPSDIGKITKLPKYPIDHPDQDHLAVLNYLIDEGPVTKSDLIEFSEDFDLNFLSGFKGQEKAKYRRLDTNVIDPLLDNGYITVQKEGRNKLVDITDAGRKFRNAFVHIVERQTRLGENFNPE